jgi:hypothetical protein
MGNREHAMESITGTCTSNLVTLLALLLQMVLAMKAFSMTYSVTGTMSIESRGPNESLGQKHVALERTFEVAVDDHSWEIRVVLVGNANYRHFGSAYDGTNITYVSRPSGEAFDRLQKGVPRALYESCEVESGPVPRMVGSVGIPYVWLAFASGAYFTALTNNDALDLYPLTAKGGLYTARQQVPCRVSLSPAPPYLPIEAEYLRTNWARMNDNGKVVTFPLPTPFQSGFPALRFESMEFTNVGRLSLPTRFEIREYMILPQATNGNGLRCIRVVRGALTSVSRTRQPGPNELVGQVFQVADLRLAPGTMYLISNGIIPTTNDPRLAAAQAQAVTRVGIMQQKRLQDTANASHRRMLSCLLMALVFLSPLAFLLRGKRSDINTRKPMMKG